MGLTDALHRDFVYIEAWNYTQNVLFLFFNIKKFKLMPKKYVALSFSELLPREGSKSVKKFRMIQGILSFHHNVTVKCFSDVFIF